MFHPPPYIYATLLERRRSHDKELDKFLLEHPFQLVPRVGDMLVLPAEVERVEVGEEAYRVDIDRRPPRRRKFKVLEVRHELNLSQEGARIFVVLERIYETEVR